MSFNKSGTGRININVTNAYSSNSMKHMKENVTPKTTQSVPRKFDFGQNPSSTKKNNNA